MRPTGGEAPRLRATHAVVPAYLLAAVVLTWPLAADLSRGLPTVLWEADALLQAFILGWDWKALAQHPLRVFDAPIFHPEPRALTFMDHLLGEAVLAWPVRALGGGLGTAYNTLVLLSFVASGWALYRLARQHGVSRAGAWLAGLLFAFAPYRFCNLCDLNLLQTQFLPLGLLFAWRWVARRRRRDLAATALVVATQSWFGWYYTVYLVMALALIVAYETWKGRLRWSDGWWKEVGVAGVAAAALMLPSLWPYVEQRRSMAGFERTLGQNVLYSADLMDYLRTNFHNRLSAGLPWRMGDLAYWPGLVAVGLAAMGWRWRATGFYRVLTVGAFVLSLGPLLRVAGRTLPIPLPYAALFFVPGFDGMRAPGRFAVLVMLALAMLAAHGYDRWRARIEPGARWGGLLFAACIAIACAEAWTVPVPMVLLPQRDAIPPAYAWLARAPGSFAILELPAPAREADETGVHALRQLYVLEHGRPILDGVSGFVPPGVRRLREVVQRFPDSEALRAAAERGARYLLVHYGDFEPARAESLRVRAAAAPGLVERARFGTDVIYELGASGVLRGSRRPGGRWLAVVPMGERADAAR